MFDNELKTISIKELESIISKAISDFTGKTYASHISTISYGETFNKMSLQVQITEEFVDKIYP